MTLACEAAIGRLYLDRRSRLFDAKDLIIIDQSGFFDLEIQQPQPILAVDE
jgi:hypothetical protein